MSEKTVAYIINESRGPESTPKITHKKKSFVRFAVDTLQEGGDYVNRNNRKYGWKLLTDGIAHPYIQERLKTHTLYCEAGHPVEQSVERQMRIDRRNVSCIIKELTQNKPKIGGILETAATALGKDLMGLIVENQCKVAFSMRGLGKVTQRNGVLDVQPPLRIITWDEVIHPSVDSAYMSNIISEDTKAFMTNKNVNENLIILAESEFAKYILETDPGMKDTLDATGIDPFGEGNTMRINEDGLLEVRQDGQTLLCIPEGYVRKEIDDYLVSL